MEVLRRKPPRELPEKVLVRPFEFYDPAVRVDRGGPALDRFKYDFQERFTRNLVKRLPKYVAPAEAIAATAPLPRGKYWLVTGRFDRLNQGSRLMRSVIGFGVGGTKMETSVLVYDLSGKRPRPFLLIETTGGSNAAPGAIGTAAYFLSGVTALGSVANLLEGVRSGLTFDTIRTTREVNAAMAEYLRDVGADAPEKNPIAKRPGQLSYRWWPFRPRAEKRGAVTVSPAPTP